MLHVVDYLKRYGIEKLKRDFLICVNENEFVNDNGTCKSVFAFNSTVASPNGHAITLECRGLYLDDQFNIVSRSFDPIDKYFKDEIYNDTDSYTFYEGTNNDKPYAVVIKIFYFNLEWHIGGNYSADDSKYYADNIYWALDVKGYSEFQDFCNQNLDIQNTYLFDKALEYNLFSSRPDPYDIYYLTARRNCTGEFVSSIPFKDKPNIKYPQKHPFQSVQECVEASKNLKKSFVVYKSEVPFLKIRNPNFIDKYFKKFSTLNYKDLFYLYYCGRTEEYIRYFPETKSHILSFVETIKEFLEKCREKYDGTQSFIIDDARSWSLNFKKIASKAKSLNQDFIVAFHMNFEIHHCVEFLTETKFYPLQVVDYLNWMDIEELKRSYFIHVKCENEGTYKSLFIFNSTPASPKGQTIPLECHGLFLDNQFNIVSRSFDPINQYYKGGFYTNKDDSYTFYEFTPDDKRAVIKMYYWDFQWHIGTNHAADAHKEFIDIVYSALDIKCDSQFQDFCHRNMDKENTYLFDIIFNVTSLKDYDLRYLAARRNDTGEFQPLVPFKDTSNIKYPQIYHFKCLQECVDASKNLKKSFVVYKSGIPFLKIRHTENYKEFRKPQIFYKDLIQLYVEDKFEDYINCFPENKHAVWSVIKTVNDFFKRCREQYNGKIIFSDNYHKRCSFAYDKIVSKAQFYNQDIFVAFHTYFTTHEKIELLSKVIECPYYTPYYKNEYYKNVCVESYKGDTAIIDYRYRQADDKFREINLGFAYYAGYEEHNLVIYIVEESIGNNAIVNGIVVKNAIVHTEHVYVDNYDDGAEQAFADTYIDINKIVKKESRFVKILIGFEDCYSFDARDFELYDYKKKDCCSNKDVCNIEKNENLQNDYNVEKVKK